jgi:DNA-binding GntR family transcriptional regulator
MDECDEIQEIRDRLYFLAVKMFNRPLTPEDLPWVEDIAERFEEFVFRKEKPGRKAPA